jgi:dTDP-glucose 4,6-dehydratase
MQTTLVAGGAGFLGSHMCERLVHDGHRVVCVDNESTGNRANLTALAGNPRFRFLKHDVTTPLTIEEPLDSVLDFACPASPKDYLRLPIPTMKAGAFGTYNLLELALAKGSVFLITSTSEVYGDPQVNPQTEEYWGYVNPIGPRSVYDEAKRYSEALTAAYQREYGLEVRIARIFNTYGPRMRPHDGRAVSTFCWQALRHEPLTIYGDGSQTRSFCYVDDLIEGLCRLLNSAETGPINLGNPDEITVLALAKEIVALGNSRSPLTFELLPTDDPRIRRPDITRAKQYLDWQPKISRTEGLTKTLAHFRDVLAAGRSDNAD